LKFILKKEKLQILNVTFIVVHHFRQTKITEQGKNNQYNEKDKGIVNEIPSDPLFEEFAIKRLF